MTTILRLDFQPSRCMAGCLAALHAAALAAAIASIAIWPVILVAAGIILSGIVAVYNALRHPPGRVCSLELRPDDTVRWRDQGGHWHTAVIAAHAYVSAWLLVLGLQEGSGGGTGSRWMVLAPDSSDSDSLRQLRVRLRGLAARTVPPSNHAAG